jgi:Zn-finger nucleic acid-binding protein
MNMRCPVDGAVLLLGERLGVEIDYCPECRGVWLDRGELDTLLARARREPAGTGNPDRPGEAAQHDKKKKGRMSFLADILGGGDD